MGIVVGPRRIIIASAFDADAQAVITAIESTGVTLTTTEKNACNQLILDLKGYSIWTKMKALYGFLGGTAAAHKFNWKDPRDLDAAFRLVFSGGWTHSSTGALPNGTNAYANTFLSTSLIGLNSGHLAYYSRSNTIISGGEMGYLKSGPDSYTDLGARFGTFGAYIRYNISTAGTFVANTDSRGFYTGTRTGATTTKLFKNGSSIQTLNTNTSSTATVPIFIGAENNVGTGTLNNPDYYSNRECAFASIGDGLTDTEAANFYTAVQAYNTTLSRQV